MYSSLRQPAELKSDDVVSTPHPRSEPSFATDRAPRSLRPEYRGPAGLSHYSYQTQPPVLQPGPQYASGPGGYRPYSYGNGVPSQLPASSSMGNSMVQALPLPTMTSAAPAPSLPGLQSYQPHTFDTTGQVAPPGMKPRVTATLWEDEGSLCFQVEAKGVCVARREDNHMINGTKLLNVAGMTRGRRDGILKSETTRQVVKIGPMHLKGVWIPFERALDFANKEKITEQLYPLFVHDIGALLYHPTNQPHAGVGAGVSVAAADRNRVQASSQPPLLHHHHSMSNPIGGHMPQPPHAIQPHPSAPRPGLDRAHTFPTPPTSASSIMGSIGNQESSYEWIGSNAQPMPGSQPLNTDTGLSSARSMPTTPASTPPGSPTQGNQSYSPSQVYDRSWEMSSALPTGDSTPPRLAQSGIMQSINQSDEYTHGTPRNMQYTWPPSNAQTTGNHEVETAGSKTQWQSPDEAKPANMWRGEYGPEMSDEKSVAATRTTKMRSSRREYHDSNEANLSHLVRPSSNVYTVQPQKDSPKISHDSALDFESKVRRSSTPNEMQSEPSTTCTASSVPYSSYDDSSEEESFNLPARKKRVIDHIMAEFYTMFDAIFGIRYAASGQPNSAQQGSMNCIDPSNSGSTQPQNGKRKADDEEHQGDGEDGDEKPPKKSKLINDEDLECQRRLACPYFKRNPRKYRNVHSCLGPGWIAIARLKEHLYRRHALPIQCSRCCQIFKSDSELKTHSRLREGCDIQDEEPLEGFDLSQEKRLRSRKKGPLGDSREDQWRELYLVLFPDAKLPEVPSPYYDYEGDAGQLSMSSPSSTGFARYDAYLRRELPQRVRQELEAEMEEELGLVDEKLKSRLSMIVRNCLEQLCRTYKGKSPTTEEAIQDKIPASEPGSINAVSSELTGSNTFAGPSTEDDLAAFQVPSEACLEMWDDFMAYTHMDGGEPSDSGYGSLGQSLDPIFAAIEDNFQPSEPDQSWMASLLDPQPGSVQLDATQPSHLPQNYPERDEAGGAYLGKGKGRARDEESAAGENLDGGD